MIEGVKVKNLKVIPDERGRLMEILRCDDEMFIKFGQVYMSATYPGVVKGWHIHQVQVDNIACIRGMIKLVLYDAREGSKTKGLISELYIGEHKPTLVQVPNGVFHGWKCISKEEALVINCVTEPYHYDKPDQDNLPPHGGDVPYDWNRKDG
jgi:dTDP-4-dehydrorhamnose 3,5-epimerase